MCRCRSARAVTVPLVGGAPGAPPDPVGVVQRALDASPGGPLGVRQTDGGGVLLDGGAGHQVHARLALHLVGELGWIGEI